MEIINACGLGFNYPESSSPALYGIDLKVKPGEFMTICGPSGCGKSTLLHMLKPSLTPAGAKTGSLLYDGTAVDDLSQRQDSESIGFIMQDPSAQIVTDKVWHELAFGLESLGLPSDVIRARVAEISVFFGIDKWYHKSCDELSGGQKQILNLAAVMVMQPKLLLLDEPMSRLDPIASRRFISILKRVNQELGTTVMIAEHALDQVLPISDRVILMDNGHIVSDCAPEAICRSLKGKPMFSALPAPARVCCTVSDNGTVPLTTKDGRAWLTKQSIKEVKLTDKDPIDSSCAIRADSIWFRYGKNEPDIIKGAEIDIKKGEIYALLGGNGTGKSTLLSVIGSLKKHYRGKVKVYGKTALLPQEPRAVFTHKTLGADLSSICKDEQIVADITQKFGISGLLDRHPYDLSGGEEERAALAKIMLTTPDILLLDEPTKGMDAPFKAVFAGLLKALQNDGVTIVIVSHDTEFCAKYADRCGLMFDGKIVSEAAPRRFFCANSFYTTPARLLANDIIPDAILDEDIIKALGGSYDPPKTDSKPEKKKEVSSPVVLEPVPDGDKRRPVKKNKTTGIVTAFISIAAALLTVLCGMYLFGDRKYYFISLLLIIEALIPFMLRFEKRKPRSRELVLLSVLCAIVVTGRLAFFMIPQVKPTLALVIIFAAALGGESGFVIGAVSAFISNIFFGQGPWTPWQMFALAFVGLLSGLIFKNGSRKRLPLMIFGFAAALIYGGIMNPAMVLMTGAIPTLDAIISAYALGLPFDLINAVSTSVFILLLSEPMLSKLDRVRSKYGLN